MGRFALSSNIGNDQFVDSVIATYKNQPIPNRLKQDHLEITAFLNQQRVKAFYHFTDWRNLESIKAHGGLYSWMSCNEKNIDIFLPGGNILSRHNDRKNGTQDYVKLSFCRNHPMAYRVAKEKEAELVLLAIDPRVATWDSTLFTDLNSTDSYHHCGGHSDFLREYIDFEAIHTNYLRREDPRFKRHQAEVMVHQHVPLDYILNIDSPIVLRF